MSGSQYGLKCPHCRHVVRVRNSVEIHELLRAMYLQCTNVNCGATFRAQLEFTHIMSPSACANPAFELPFADCVMRRQAIANADEKQMDIDEILLTEEPSHESE